jgi:16S rRNA G966 N2-methylase RsmD
MIKRKKLSIITGKFKRRSIKFASANKNTKAMLTRIRIDIFNILNNHLDWEGKIVCDPFCGTGSLIFESLSRNCLRVYANDLSRQNYKFLKQNALTLQIENQLQLRNSHYKDFFR